MNENRKICRKCASDDWTECIDKVVYHSGRGMKSVEVEMQEEIRLCRRCGHNIQIAIAFSKKLPKGFGWKQAVIYFKGGRRVEEERLLLT